MKRRDFIKTGSAALPLSAMTGLTTNQNPVCWHYPTVHQLKDVQTREGDTLVRIKIAGKNNFDSVLQAGSIQVEHGTLTAITPHSFESIEDHFNITDGTFQLQNNRKKADIFLLRFSWVDTETRVHLSLNQQNIHFYLTDILETGYLRFETNQTRVDINFLLDKEIGEINLTDIGIQNNSDSFSFHIFADPQGGDPLCPGNHRTRMKIHNAFLEDAIVLANSLPRRPLFTLMLGDIVDSQGQPENFAAMHQFFTRLDSPILYELGNHESKYKSTFEPGYDMNAFQNYFTAQKKINGMDKILYSFNAGQWHFVVWPDPLRTYFWDNHPHYFEWLARDLEKHKDRPTFIFQHVPVHPIGISPFQAYLDYTAIRRKFIDIVTKYGNVKYVLSGHIHIPVKSSFKTACQIKGTNFITLPAAGFRPRGFGEQDYFGGPTQGIAIVNIQGDDAKVKFKTVMEEEWTYPDQAPELDLNRYQLWFNNKWDLKARSNIQNGSFKNGLTGWIPEYIYQEDENPSVKCEATKDGLYLYNRIRGYQAPGQDRLPQTINRISQIIQAPSNPVLHLKYRLDQNQCDLNGLCGGYLWIEGYTQSFRQFNLLYSAGTAFASPIAKYSERNHAIHHFDLPAHFDWSDAVINIADDFNQADGKRKYNTLNCDRLVLTLGVWTVNEGREQPFGIYFKDFKLISSNKTHSLINGIPMGKKHPDRIWWQGKHIPFIHVAGEHRYHLDTLNETLFHKEFERFQK